MSVWQQTSSPYGRFAALLTTAEKCTSYNLMFTVHCSKSNKFLI